MTTENKANGKMFILYDSRVDAVDADDCTVFCTAMTEIEVKKYSRNFAEDSVWFEYDMKGKEIINERRWKTCGEVLRGK